MWLTSSPRLLLWLAVGAARGAAIGGILECAEVRRTPPLSASGPSLLADKWPPGVRSALGAARALWGALVALPALEPEAARVQDWGQVARALLTEHRPVEAVAVQTPSKRLLVYRRSVPPPSPHSTPEPVPVPCCSGPDRVGVR